MLMSFKKINYLESLLKNLRAKLLSDDQPAGKKLQATGGRILAIKELQERDPSKDWSKLIPKDEGKMPKQKEKIVIKSNGQWNLIKSEDNEVVAKSPNSFIKNKASEILEILEKASRKQLESMIGPDASMPHHQEAVKKIRSLFPNSTHDVWLTKHYRQNPKLLEDHAGDLAHISAQMKVHDELKNHDVSKMSFEEGLNSLKQKDKEISEKKAKDLENSFYSPSSDTEKILDADSSSWFNTKQPSCDKIGALCGHCGNTGGPHEEDNLLYLGTRHNLGNKEVHKPSSVFIENNGFLGEMKGKFNKKPGQEDHEAIAKLLMHPMIQGIIGGGYEPHNNFALADLPQHLQDQVLRVKPNIDALGTSQKLNVEDFPDKFRGQVQEHNDAVAIMDRNSHNPDGLLKELRDGTIGADDLESIIRHPKFYKYFNKDHLNSILNHFIE